MAERAARMIALKSALAGCALAFAAAPAVHAAQPAPDFSGRWGRNAFDLEPLPSGLKPISNLQRLETGSGDPQRPIADYNNPLLTPKAAAIVKQRSEAAAKGDVFADPSNQCAPYPVPFIFGMQLGMNMFQSKDKITFLYNQDSQVRHVRLNGAHPTKLTPSWKGDSIAHYEGDTLVIDTVGIKTGPDAVADRYGMPFSEGIHVVERYRLIDAAEAKAAQERHEKNNGRVGGPQGAMPIDAAYGKGLQLHLTIENPGYYAQPLTATVTYRRATMPWQELVCAENTFEYYSGKHTPIPTAQRPDF